MDYGYQTSRLWNEAFSAPESDEEKRLAEVYKTAWERASSLANHIGHDLPGLTLHDDRHFSALWRMADILVPEDEKLSPVELFVFGMAILIHDIGHTIIAYQGGIEEIIETESWRDNLSIRYRDKNPSEVPTYELIPHKIRSSIMFDTLRELHAAHAANILTVGFEGLDKTRYYILEDPQLRKHMTEIIGKIATSHHWSLQKVMQLPRQEGTIAPYDKFGPIRTMLLAALLRTADAIQIDGSRAPDFDFALSSPEGDSKLHWNAQNRLSVARDSQDKEALAINTTVSFTEEEVRDWWVAYDLAKIADRELRGTDGILVDCAQPRLTLRRVKGIGSPEEFARTVITRGWQPHDAELKIGDPAKLVEVFGGTGLYGQDHVVPIRELLQNAADAVRARRLLDDGYTGKITIVLENKARGEEVFYSLKVIDDGMGMSPSILTGPFLTFGQSGWMSNTLKHEKPGFMAKSFRPKGRFGIGFFSVFMLSRNVRVTSRAFDKALDQAMTLDFRDSLRLRPILKGAISKSSSEVTVVELEISQETKRKIFFKSAAGRDFQQQKGLIQAPEKAYQLHELVGMLCAMIDVDIECHDLETGRKELVAGDWKSCEPTAWTVRITGRNAEDFSQIICNNLDLIEVIGAPENPIGRASLNPHNKGLGIYAINGFSPIRTSSLDTTQKPFIGCIDTEPSGPSRKLGSIEDLEEIKKWAQRQVSKWAALNIDEQEKNFIACNAAKYGADISEIANVMIDGTWRSLDEVFEILKTYTIFAPIENKGYTNTTWKICSDVNLTTGLLYYQPDVVVDLKNVITSGTTSDCDAYWSVPTDDTPANSSFLRALASYCLRYGKQMQYDGGQIDFGYYSGQTIKRWNIRKGDRIVVPGLSIFLA